MSDAVCYDTFGGTYACNSAWSSWGRWAAFGVIVGVALVFFLLCGCLNARRRRSRGMRPFYGTQWMAPPTYQQSQWQNPPPQYEQQDPNYGYYPPQQPPPPPQGSVPFYGRQENGIELQQPQSAYHGGEQVYAPPAGPPGKK